MDLPTLCNSPRACYLGDRRYWVRPLSLDALGTILGWLDDVLPGREDRKVPPRIGDPASQEALRSAPGMAILAWLALRGEESDISEETAAELVRAASAVERALLLDILFRRRRSRRPGEDGEDIAEMWWGPYVIRLMDRYPGLMPEAIGRLTLDQLDCLAGEGCTDEDPSLASPELLAELDRQARANAARVAGTEAP